MARPLARAFALFSPEGERSWVPGWVPDYLHPVAIPSSDAGTVFRTAHRGEDTLWIVLHYDRDRGRAEYVRVTADSRAGTVLVTGVEREGVTEVEVTYRLTALSEAGNDTLRRDFAPDAYAAMLRDWEAAIARLPAEVP